MKAQRIAIGLTVLNLLILGYAVCGATPTPPAEIAPVLRAHALEIVDDQGRVRAMIRVFPPDPSAKMPDGTTGYPETVLLRLINSKGAPNVKISATEDGSGIGLGGASNPTYMQLLARGDTTLIKLFNKDGQQQVIKP